MNLKHLSEGLTLQLKEKINWLLYYFKIIYAKIFFAAPLMSHLERC